MSEEYVGAISMQVDGQDYTVISANEEINTGRKPLKGSKGGKAGTVGFAQGAAEFKLKIQVPVSIDPTENYDWENLIDGRLIIQEHGGKRTAYVDCFSTTVSASYKIEGDAAVRDVEIYCAEKVQE